tara:strand:+ start:1834 stop:2274 length:441 start_codon:yes stop_codon:yes gene_type:complete
MESTGRKSTIEEPVYTDIRKCWNVIKTGILEVLKENPHLTYIPEDVYSECVNERAFLYTSPVGFLILTTEVDQFTKDKTLLLWIAYTYNKGGHNWLSHEEWFNNLAREAGCKYLEARSRVPEMESYVEQIGWELDTRIYRKKVDGK